MPLYHIILLALVQGVTEFLPVSSSGHLVLLPWVSGRQDQGQVLDVAVHLGTLVAVVFYVRAELARVMTGVGQLVRGTLATPEAFLALALGIATVPVVIVGLFVKLTGLDQALRSVAVIGWAMLVFGVLLYWADQRFACQRATSGWTLRHAVLLGLWQAIALIPGTSRSGICITGARTLGYSRTASARLAMLMSVPTILAAGVLSGIEVASDADLQTARDGAIAAGLSCLAALAALAGMMRFLRVVSYTPYVVYRIALGSILLLIAYS